MYEYKVSIMKPPFWAPAVKFRMIAVSTHQKLSFELGSSSKRAAKQRHVWLRSL